MKTIMRRDTHFKIILVVAVTLIVARAASAQSTTIAGAVTDAQGGALPGPSWSQRTCRPASLPRP